MSEQDEMIAGLGDVYDQALSDDEGVMAELSPSYAELASYESQYDEEELIGQGAVKDVYRCFDKKTKREVCLARPRAHLDHEFYELFIHEAWLTSSLKHPNIIKIHEVSIDQHHRPYFTMDLKGNSTLEDFVSEERSLEESLEVFYSICDAMAYAHAEGVIHLDLKPANIQCDKYGEVLVCDWGLGKVLDQEEEVLEVRAFQAMHQTLYGEVRGSLGYMAPEQVEEGGQKGEYTDIYALGCLLYYIMMGRAPYEGDKATVLELTRQSTPVEMVGARRRVPGAIEAVVRKAMSKSVNERYSTVSELKEDLLRYSRGYATQAERPSAWQEVLLFCRRERVKLLTGGAVALVTLIAVGLYQVQSHQISKRDRELTESKTLLMELQELSEEYKLFEQAVTDSKEALAQKINAVVYRTVTNVYRSEDPVKTVNEQLILLNKSREMYREEYRADMLLARLNCVARDFEAVLANPAPQDAPYYRYYARLAQLYLSSEWADRQELTTPEFADFILLAGHQDFGEYDYLNRNVMVNMVYYDWHQRTDRDHYANVVGALISTFRRHGLAMSYDYDYDERRLTLSTSITAYFNPKNEKSRLMKFVDVDELRMEVGDMLAMTHLHEMRARRLDVVDVGWIAFPDEGCHIIGLEELVVAVDGLSDELIRKKLTSTKPYRIIRRPRTIPQKSRE